MTKKAKRTDLHEWDREADGPDLVVTITVMLVASGDGVNVGGSIAAEGREALVEALQAAELTLRPYVSALNGAVVRAIGDEISGSSDPTMRRPGLA